MLSSVMVSKGIGTPTIITKHVQVTLGNTPDRENLEQKLYSRLDETDSPHSPTADDGIHGQSKKKRVAIRSLGAKQHIGLLHTVG